MSLRSEIQADIYSGEMDDLFQEVMYNGKPAVAMVETTSTMEGMDSLGGNVLSGERSFKFRRDDLLKLRSTLGMIQDEIEFAGRTYDVTEFDERPGHPIVIVKGELRQ